MQNLFTCFLFGILIWLMQDASQPPAEPAVYIGFLTVVSVLAARLAGRRGVSPALGALAAGLLLRKAGIIPDAALSELRPFADLAAIWVGLSLGAFLSPARMRDRQLTACAGLMAAGGGLAAFGMHLLVFHASPESALGIGIAATLSAPFFLPQRRQALSLSLLATGFGLLLWGVCRLLLAPPAWTVSAGHLLTGLAVWGIGLELVYRILRKARTAPGRYVTLSVLAFLILLASRQQQISPLALSGLSGLALSLRSGSNRRPLLPLEPLSNLLVLPVLADFAARLAPLRAGWPFWEFLLTYAAGMVAGKAMGGTLGGRLTGLPFRIWVQALPQGMLACMLFPHVGFSGGVPSLSSPMAAQAILLCGIGIQALVGPARSLADWLEGRRATDRLPGDTGRHLREESD